MLRPLLVLFAVAMMLSLAPPLQAQTAPGCQFILGFKTLHDMDPQDTGDCTDNQAFASNGDAQQHTTKGLMAWRKADNYTAFTNGYRTWINGPGGLVNRLNTDRFPWESNAPIAAPAPAPTPEPTPSGPQPSAVITITDSGYQPAGVTIVTGGSVTWINKGTRTHSATSIPGNAPLPFDTGGINPGQQVSLRFSLPGGYNFTSQPDCVSGNMPGFTCFGYTINTQGPAVSI